MHTYVAFLHIRSTGQRWFALCRPGRWDEATAVTRTCHDYPGGQDDRTVQADRNAFRQSSGLTIEQPICRTGMLCMGRLQSFRACVSRGEVPTGNHRHRG